MKHKKVFPLRLLIAFFLIFISFAVTTIVIILFFIFNQLDQQKQTQQAADVLKLWAGYQNGGIAEIDRILHGRFAEAGLEYIVRIIDNNNNQLLFVAPRQWSNFDFSPLLQNNTPGNELLLYSDSLSYNLKIKNYMFDQNFILQIGYSNITMITLYNTFLNRSMPLIVLLLAVSLSIGVFIVLIYFRPLSILNKTIQSIISTKNYSKRILTKKNNNMLNNLSLSFNNLLDTIEAGFTNLHSSIDLVAHELKTPLTAIRLIAERGATAKIPQTQKESLFADILESCDKILQLNNTLLDLAAADSGELILNLQNCDAEKLISDVVDMYSIVAEEHHIIIYKQIVSKTAIYADPIRLRQAIANLVDNAIKFCDKNGKILISLEVKNKSLCITVANSGNPIDTAIEAQIWQKLYHHGTQAPGLGLGLALVRAIAEAHMGTAATIIPDTGYNTAFLIKLPLIDHST